MRANPFPHAGSVTTFRHARSVSHVRHARSVSHFRHAGSVSHVWLLALVLLAIVVGCGGPKSYQGSGITGTIACQGTPLAEIRIEVFELNTPTPGSPKAFAVSKADGRFELFAEGGKRPELAAGEYRVTLENLGAPTITFAPAATNAATTPLRCTIVDGKSPIQVEVPAEVMVPQP